jgi:hypothetical protein
MQGCSILQGRCILVEIHFYDCWVTFRTLFSSSGNPVSTLREQDKTIAHIAVKSPLGSTYRIQNKCPIAFGASTNPLSYQRMSTCRMRTEEAWHAGPLPQHPRTTGLRSTKESVYTFKRRTIVAERTKREWLAFWTSHGKDQQLKVVQRTC